MLEEVKKIIDEEIAPILARDGGSIELIDVKDDIVKVKLKGACYGCPMAQYTLLQVVQAKIKQRIPNIKTVENVP